MKTLLEKAGLSFARAVGVAALAYIPGILNAPNKNASFALAIGASYGILTAGFRAIQVFAPQITTGNAIIDAGLRMFTATLIANLTGFLTASTHDFGKSALLALLLGALAAGFRAVQATVTTGEAPLPASGVSV